MEKIEKIRGQIKEFDDLCGVDLSNEDLGDINIDVLLKCDFDTRTIWPEADKLPVGFNPKIVIEEGKNPGLGIEELHKQGIDGRGVTVGIIDQSMSFEDGKFAERQEFASNVVNYKEFGLNDDWYVSYHGSAVTSLLVGKTCGIAPGAKLVYRAASCGETPDDQRDFNAYADALLDIIELNKTLPIQDRVRIVSCSIGYMEDNPEPGLDRWIETIRLAEDVGIVVSDVGRRTGVDYIGGGTSGDKNNIEGYKYALFLKDDGEDDEILSELISKKDVDGILRRLRETKKEKLEDKTDTEIRERIEKALSNESRKAIIVPSDYRTMSSRLGPGEYMYNGKGGMSWAVPYLSGIFALVWQIKPDLKKGKIAEIINQTATVNSKGIRVINPIGIIEEVEKLDSDIVVKWFESLEFDNFEISCGDSYTRGILNKEHGVIYINEVFVPSNIRETGIGTKLIERLKLEASVRGAKLVTGEVRSLGGLKVFRKVFPSSKIYKRKGTFLHPKDPTDEIDPDEIIARGSDAIVVDVVSEV
jgi:serine protease AprX